VGLGHLGVQSDAVSQVGRRDSRSIGDAYAPATCAHGPARAWQEKASTHLPDVVRLDVELLLGRSDAEEVGLVVQRRSGDVGVAQDSLLQQLLGVTSLALLISQKSVIWPAAAVLELGYEEPSTHLRSHLRHGRVVLSRLLVAGGAERSSVLISAPIAATGRGDSPSFG